MAWNGVEWRETCWAHRSSPKMVQTAEALQLLSVSVQWRMEAPVPIDAPRWDEPVEIGTCINTNCRAASL
jgi:hypothetical protein